MAAGSFGAAVLCLWALKGSCGGGALALLTGYGGIARTTAGDNC